jgi:Na+-transporting NADH:ubiquinone oxidoreductase subunit B
MMRFFSKQYPNARHAPFLHAIWTGNIISFIFLLALILPTLVIFIETKGAILPILGLSGLVSLFWNIIFSRIHKQLPTLDWIVTAISFSLFVPPSLPLWQVALGLSFGIVIGEQIFGGRGLNFLNPVIVALTFLAFSFPGFSYYIYSDLFAFAVLPGAILLIVFGLISWRILVGSIFVMLGVFVVSGYAEPFTIDAIVSFFSEKIMLGSLLFGLIFFACDPVCSAATNPARWIYGGLIGLLIALFAMPSESFGSPTTIIFAILLASVFAPLIDYFVIALNARHRRRSIEKT